MTMLGRARTHARARARALAGPCGLALVLAALAGACGGSKDASPARAPSNNDVTPSSTHAPAGPGGDSAQEPKGGFAPPPPAPTAGMPGGMDRDAARVQARDALARAERELETSTSDCATACRALGSLERATSRLCQLAESPDDRRRCEDAQKKLGSARDRVKQTCSVCPGGPTLDRNAPLPPATPDR